MMFLYPFPKAEYPFCLEEIELHDRFGSMSRNTERYGLDTQPPCFPPSFPLRMLSSTAKGRKAIGSGGGGLKADYGPVRREDRRMVQQLVFKQKALDAFGSVRSRCLAFPFGCGRGVKLVSMVYNGVR